MAVIQPYTERVSAQGGLNVQASPEEFGAGIGSAIHGFGESIRGYEHAVYKAESEKEATAAHQLISQKTLEWTQQLTDRANAAQPGDTTFAPGVIEDINKDMAASAEKFTTQHGQSVFSDLSAKLATSFGIRAIGIQSQLAGAARTQGFNTTLDAEAKIVNGNDGEYRAAKERTEGLVNSYTDIDATHRESLKQLRNGVLSESAMEGMAARDVVGLTRKLLPDLVNEAYSAAVPAVGNGSKFDNVMKFIFKEEGGYNARDGNSGSPVNFGINQKANPEVDVAKLTKEGASNIYLTKYWNSIGGDNLPANMAVVAMNAAVNQGPEVAKTLLAQSGGDPATFTELAKQRYQAIAQANPDQAKYLGGWLARADRAMAASSVPVDAQGQPIPQIRVPKDAALSPPQNVGIEAWNDMRLDAQQKFLSKLVTDFNARVAVDRATLADDRKNMTANFLAGNSYSEERSLQSRYAAAYGPEMAKRMVQEDALNKDLGQFSKGIKGRSMAEITATIGAAPGDNSSADEYGIYSRKIAVVQADRAELQKDPVGYVARYSTPVQQAAIIAQSARAAAEQSGAPEAIDAAANATQRLITASLAEQRRLGVASPAILSDAEEKLLTQKIQEISGSGRDVAQSIDALYKSYGSYGPTVADQMSKKLGGFMNVLGSGLDQGAATLLVEANRNKDALKKTLPDDKLKDLDNAVQSVMAPYSASLAGSPNSAVVQSTYQEQISNLAMLRMSKYGESQSDAVQKAYKSLVGDMYKFQDGYRVPANLDAKVIRAQATTFINNLSERDVAPLPGSLGNSQDRMAAQLSAIRSYGKWVTSSRSGPDGKSEEGLFLTVRNMGGGFDAVTGPDGKPVFRSFGQLITEYHSSNVQTSQDALARGDMKKYWELRVLENGNIRRAEDQRARDEGRAYRARKQGLIP